MSIQNKRLNAQEVTRREIYWPVKRPGFVAWTTAFSYNDGSIGLSFKETREEKNSGYIPPKLELGEAMGAPVSYCSVECPCEDQVSYRVYLRSFDNGKTFTETGRCQLEQGSFCNVGFPDGRILGIDVPRANEAGTSWSNAIIVRESKDGGTTWSEVTRLLEGCAPYLWRVRQLRDKTIVICACLYGTPWGEGEERTTRNTMLPGETYLNKIQTFFMTSRDGGRTFDGPHYILPGTGAHEFDFVELEDGSLLFIAGDVQGTPVARQIVKKHPVNGYVNGTLYGIKRGAPANPQDLQSGFVPETLVMLPDGLIVGSRRNKPYSCSNDLGENWFEIDNLPTSLYQPFMLKADDGTIINFGHFGGDSALGQVDMYVGADYFKISNCLPKSAKLTLCRQLDPSGTRFVNHFSATLTVAGKPVPGKTLTFRFQPVWDSDGSVFSGKQENALIIREAITDENGVASAGVPEFDGIGDIHFYYNADVVFRPGEEEGYLPCDGPMMCVAALTPHRFNRYPYDAYFAEGSLYLSPKLLEAYPELLELLRQECLKSSEKLTQGILPEEAVRRLLKAGVLQDIAGEFFWRKSVHAPRPLKEVLRMAGGDWYI